jgi:hypothetical protein
MFTRIGGLGWLVGLALVLGYASGSDPVDAPPFEDLGSNIYVFDWVATP